MPQTSFLREYYMEVIKLNQLNNYGVSERFFTEATLYPEYQLARVIAQYRGKYKIVTEQGEMLAEISGKLRYDTEELAQYPAVGDCVMVDIQPELAVIHRVLNQNFSLNRMERYLSIAWDSGAVPVIVLTKSDLCDDLPQAVSQVENISSFSDVIPLSMFDADIGEKFQPYFQKNQTCAFIGSSGVGKSTLINKLLGNTVMETQEIGRGDKGRHTTTGREMFPCPLGGVVIDTPGMREMGAESADLSKTFAEIEELARHCRFRDCTHTSEPGCAVLAAVESGELDSRRLESYHKLEHETSYDGLSSKEIEVKKCERMFKEVGGMKNARRFAKEQRKRK